MAEPPNDAADETAGDAGDETASDDASPGDEPVDEFDAIQTELQHAREDARREISEPLNQVTVALDSMQSEDETDARPDRLESLERELVELQSDAEGETKERIRDAAKRIERLREIHEREE